MKKSLGLLFLLALCSTPAFAAGRLAPLDFISGDVEKNTEVQGLDKEITQILGRCDAVFAKAKTFGAGIAFFSA